MGFWDDSAISFTKLVRSESNSKLIGFNFSETSVVWSPKNDAIPLNKFFGLLEYIICENNFSIPIG